MTMIALVQRHVLPAAYSLLPPMMHTPAATAMLLAIGLQESKFLHRRQIGGPARGLWQFERDGGVRGVLRHEASADHARIVLRELRYPVNATPAAVYAALADNDVLAACWARLLLWTLPQPLPSRSEQGKGWRQYIDAWRPGRPHPETWPAYYAAAWQRIDR